MSKKNKKTVPTNKTNTVKKLIQLLDSFDKLYFEHSNGKCKNYLSYFTKNFSDEKTLIQPIIFPAFLRDILNFTNLEYIPEKRNKANKAPDFTPIDTFTHDFIFETKGSDSSVRDLSKEFEQKSKFYLDQDPSLGMAIIVNMRDVIVYSKKTSMKVENFSFNIFRIYQDWKNGIFSITKNVQNFLAFVDRFTCQELTSDQKLQRIIQASPHDEKYSKYHDQIQNEKILASMRKIINKLEVDASSQGIDSMRMALGNNESRKKFIVKYER